MLGIITNFQQFGWVLAASAPLSIFPTRLTFGWIEKVVLEAAQCCPGHLMDARSVGRGSCKLGPLMVFKAC